MRAVQTRWRNMPRRKRRLASRVRHYLRALLAFLFSNVGVVVLVVAYTIAGIFCYVCFLNRFYRTIRSWQQYDQLREQSCKIFSEHRTVRLAVHLSLDTHRWKIIGEPITLTNNSSEIPFKSHILQSADYINLKENNQLI